jgi:serine/threonine-protein kinase HipA
MKTFRQGRVFYKNNFAGVVSETEEGYQFTYDIEYLNSSAATPISVILPLQKETYSSRTLHPFFDGLIPEGWLLSVVLKNWKLDARDRMGLLLTVCSDCIGAVSVEAYHA